MKTIKTIDESKVAKAIVPEIIPANFGGWTYDASEDRLAVFEKDFYVVSLRNHGVRHFPPVSVWMAYRWLLGNKEMIFQNGFYVVGWLFDGFNYLDITVAKNGRSDAESFGRIQGQTAIYYPFEKKEIFLTAKKEAV